MWKYLLDFITIFGGGLFILTQMFIPALTDKPYFPMFRKRKNNTSTLYEQIDQVDQLLVESELSKVVEAKLTKLNSNTNTKEI